MGTGLGTDYVIMWLVVVYYMLPEVLVEQLDNKTITMFKKIDRYGKWGRWNKVNKGFE